MGKADGLLPVTHLPRSPIPTLGMAVVVSVALALSACSSTSDRDEKQAAALKDQLSAMLQRDDNAGFSKEVADCYVTIVVEEAGVSALQGIDFTSGESPPPEVTKALDAAVLRAQTECPGFAAYLKAGPADS